RPPPVGSLCWRPAAQRAAARAPPLAQDREPVEHALAVDASAAAGADQLAHVEILLDGQPPENAASRRNVADAGARPVAGIGAGDVPAVKQNPTGVGRQ